MAAAVVSGVFEPTLQQKIDNSKILVVGAGGIGCEVLKNLVMSGFPDIEIVSSSNSIGFCILEKSICGVSLCAFHTLFPRVFHFQYYVRRLIWTQSM